VLNEGLREIGTYAFRDCSSLESIHLPSTIIKIDTAAFTGCFGLKTIVLNDCSLRVGGYAFRNCISLTSISLPSTIIEIDQCAFEGCALKEVVLNGDIRIGFRAFWRCLSLESVTFPSTHTGIGITAFGKDAFRGCSSLERFKFPSLSIRLDNIIQAGQRGVEAKMDDIPTVEWRGGELVIPAIHRQIGDRVIVNNPGWSNAVIEIDKEKLNKVEALIQYYEMKEATTLFELALWKSNLDQAEAANDINRDANRIEVPGPVKDTILQYIGKSLI